MVHQTPRRSPQAELSVTLAVDSVALERAVGAEDRGDLKTLGRIERLSYVHGKPLRVRSC